jgi:hypothetical protein
MGVLQLAYFSLAQHDNVNAFLEQFMRINEVNGFNPKIIEDNTAVLPGQVSSLGIDSLFINNCNLMFFLIITEVAVAGILFGLSHFVSKFAGKLGKISKYLIKEGLLTLMMFNAFNIAFGVGIHFHFGDR